MGSHPFDSDTAVRAAGGGRFEASIDNRRWWIARGPNGGFVAAIVLRAMIEALDDADRTPRSLTIHYAGAPSEGPLALDVRVERVGRTLANLSARLTQGDSLIALALGAFSRPFGGEDFATAAMPDVPPPDAIEEPEIEGRPPFTRNFDYRPAIGAAPFSGADEALSGGWIRFREPRELDWLALATLTDAWFPAIFTRGTSFGVVPTVDLTIHFRDAPPAGPNGFALARFRTSLAREGFFEEDGEIWSADGRLLVQSRQLAVLL